MAHDYYKAYKRQRKTLDINPVEKVKDSAKRYKRNTVKDEVKQHINEFYLEGDEYETEVSDTVIE